jgi:hypothetical protein
MARPCGGASSPREKYHQWSPKIATAERHGPRFARKHAIVTGGSQGIGKAIARELTRERVDVAIEMRNRGNMEATAQERRNEPAHIVPLAANVTSKEQVDRVVAEAAQQLSDLPGDNGSENIRKELPMRELHTADPRMLRRSSRCASHWLRSRLRERGCAAHCRLLL